MRAAWLILTASRTHGISAWHDAITATGRIARTAMHVPTDRDELFPDHACVVVNGIASAIEALSTTRRWKSLAWADAEAFACHTYLPHYRDQTLQQHYTILPLGTLLSERQRLLAEYGTAGRLFLRPDAHDKAFDGGVIDAADLERRASLLAAGFVDANQRCLISRPELIDAEWRLLVRRGKFVAGSSYLVAGKLNRSTPVPREVVAFAERLAATPSPRLPSVYVMDIALSESRPRLIEVGSACSSAMYGMDLTTVVDVMSAEAESM